MAHIEDRWERDVDGQRVRTVMAAVTDGAPGG